MKTWVYSWLAYPLFVAVAQIIGWFNPKIRETMRLRSWKDFLSLRFNAGNPIEYWIHVASSGELEYAIPILEELERRKKSCLVTYYSISAKGPVEALPQKFKNVSLVVPLPHDGLGLMKEFVRLARKQGVRVLLLMKYELWPGVLWECNAQGVKVYLVDALKPSWFHRKLIHKLDAILSGYDSEIGEILHPSVKVVGDTRVERVLARVGDSQSLAAQAIPPALKAKLADRNAIVFGSMWPDDDELLIGALAALGPPEKGEARPNIIWVPHELDEDQKQVFEESVRACGYQTATADQQNLSSGPTAIIVFKKGILVELYNFGIGAYVGGGFGRGVHSVWEPALAGAQVACGPRTDRSPEATALQRLGRLTVVQQSEDLKLWMNGLSAKTTSSAADLDAYVKGHRGASQRIVDFCEGLQ